MTRPTVERARTLRRLVAAVAMVLGVGLVPSLPAAATAVIPSDPSSDQEVDGGSVELLVVPEIEVADGTGTIAGQYLVTFGSEPARARGIAAIEAAGWTVLHEAGDDGESRDIAGDEAQPWALVLLDGSAGTGSTDDPAAQVAELRGLRDVVRVSPNHVRRLVQTDPPWGLDRLDQRSLPLSGSYLPGATGAGVRVYVIDDGIRREHVDFGGRVTVGASLGSLGSDSDPSCSTHGSHVAGSVGGAYSGVAKGVELIPVRVFDCNGGAYDSEVISAMEWVRTNHLERGGGTAVVNMSFGGPASTVLDAKVAELAAAGLVVVAAAGNETADACDSSPARSTSSLTVAASTSTDTRASFSNFGSCVDLFAPGASIRSVDSSSGGTTGFVSWSGTSMAAPHASGAAALIIQREPGLSAAQVRQRLISDATTGVISNPGTGTPNRLLWVAAASGGSEPGPSPTPDPEPAPDPDPAPDPEPPPDPEPAPIRPVNDDFGSAATLRVVAGSVTGNNVGATPESGEPRHAGVGGGSSVWWRFAPDRDLEVTLTTQGSTFDTVLAVYTGSSVSNLTGVASNDDADGGLQSKVTFRAAAGTTYRIAVDGFDADQGSIRLNLGTVDAVGFKAADASRLVDSRTGLGASGPLAPGQTVVVRVAGRAGVPTSASAVALNVTAVDTLDGGFVSVTPCTSGSSTPSTSNLNFGVGQTVANSVITALSADGTVCVYTSAPVDLLVDVVGAFDGGFDDVPPTRLLDTRVSGVASAGSITTVRVGGRGGVPLDASATVLNVTAVGPASAGFLTVYPCGGPPPVASNVNYEPGQVVPNAVVSQMNANGDVCIYTSSTTHLLVDVAGAFDTRFGALTPQRLLETRVGPPPSGGSVTLVDVAGRAGVPRDASAVVLNVTAVDPFGPGFVSVFPCGADWRTFQPTTSSLNYVGGRNVANAVVAPLGTAGGTSDGAVCLFTSAEAHLLVDVAGAFR